MKKILIGAILGALTAEFLVWVAYGQIQHNTQHAISLAIGIGIGILLTGCFYDL